MQHLKTILSEKYNEEICDLILLHFERMSIPKGDVLIDINDIVRDFYFIESGLFRSYYIDDRGEDLTFDFYTSGEVVTILDSLVNNIASEFCIESLQPSAVLKISKRSLESLIFQYPKLEELRFRLIVKHNEKSVARTLLHQLPTGRERLLKFFVSYPNVLYQCKNKHVASFLRLTKESFSRLING